MWGCCAWGGSAPQVGECKEARQGKAGRQAGRQCSAVQAGEELQADKQCRQTSSAGRQRGGEENEEEEEEEGQCRR